MWEKFQKQPPRRTVQSHFKLLGYTPHTKNHVTISYMKKDKPLTKKQYQQYQEELNKEKDIVKYVARILACAFLLGIIIFSLPL